MKIVGIIPARYASTRFPGKILAKIKGKPLVYYVYRQAKKSKLLNDIIIATDDERIKKAVENFGKVMLTSKKHKTGTDRIAEVARKINADIIVNIQGDEPLIKPEAIDAAIRPLLKNKKIVMSTLKTEIKKSDIENPNIVKVVTDKNGFALYFSRYPIPYQRKKGKIYKHIGLYVYRKNFLLNFTKLKQTNLEKIESLEQLRALENGYKIKVIETKYDSVGVDTKEDLEKVRKFL